MKTDTQTLTRKLDGVFSKWVRYSAAKKGVVKCVTCGKLDVPERMDAGHFVPRQHLFTRWDERNVNPQCMSCNRFKEGAKHAYAQYLMEKYGPEVIAELNSAVWKVAKWDATALKEKIDHYKTELKNYGV